MTLHLTQMMLTNAGRRLAFDAQAMHRTLAFALDGAPHLWASPDPGQVIVQADRPLRADALGPITSASHSGQRPTRFQPGQRVHAALIANPTHAISRGPRQRGHVQALPPDQWETWWIRKTAEALNTEHLTARHHRIQRGQKHGMQTTHALVAYSATCMVRDSDALEQLIHVGIGRGKAYGAGLLLIGAIR